MSIKQAKHKKLTPKQELFCYEYLANRLNATVAASKAGYSPKTAYSIGQENLKKPEIQSRIQKLKDNLAEAAGISALMIANEHAKIAFGNLASLHNTWIERKELNELTEDQKSCIQEVSTKVLKKNIGTQDEPDIIDVEYVKIKCYDKQRALDSLSNMLGYNAPVKQELTGKDGKDLFAKLTDDELDGKVSDLEKKIKLLSK